jgi:hypothetical protein
MMIRTVGIALVSLSLSAGAVYAADANDGSARTTAVGETAAPATAAEASRALAAAGWVRANHRPAALPGLYASLAALQIFDGYSTQRGLAAGAREANPVMKSVIGHSASFWTVKAAMTVAPMLAAERLWKTNKVAAIAVMVASNGVMAAVAAHNAGVVNAQR